jgi:Flp pilus assembly protein protease CpaA
VINDLILLTILFAAAYTDLKTKEVPHILFIIGFGLALILNLNNLFSFTTYLFFSIVLMYTLWKIGGFGGADAKIFILLFVFLQSIEPLIVFVITGFLFVPYVYLIDSKEKRLIPFVFVAFLIKIILFILLNRYII